MTNKEKMKKVIIEDFNKAKNNSYIIERIEENKMKKFNKIAIPSCLIILILVCGIIVFNGNNKELKNNNGVLPVHDNKIIINKVDNSDNSVSSVAGGIYDIAGGFYEKAVEELQKEYPFINHLFIFGEDTKNQKIGEYRYDELNYQGYYVIYTDNTETKGVEIFFSKTMNIKPRDIGPVIVLDELKDSYILNTPVKIIERGNSYIAFFDKNGIHLDIETNDISQEQLVDLIQKIIKSN